VGHGDRLADGKSFPLDLWRFCFKEQSDDTGGSTDAQPPDVALDQSSPQASAKEPPSDVIDEAEHLRASNLENRGPLSPAPSAMEVGGDDRERAPDDASGSKAALLVADGLLGGVAK
jgi:hypothetical protein